MPRHPARIAEDLRRESRLGGTADGLDNLCALLQEAADALDDQALPNPGPGATRVVLDIVAPVPADVGYPGAYLAGLVRGALYPSGLPITIHRPRP